MDARRWWGLIIISLCWTSSASQGSKRKPFDCGPKDEDLKQHHVQKYYNLFHPYAIPVRTKDDVQINLLKQQPTFAGRSEYPYLVEIRTLDAENWARTELWSNGNLVAARYVLTTCEAVGDFKAPHDQNKANLYQRYLERKDKNKYKVMYASDYHYKSSYRLPEDVGTRKIKAFHPHPRCNWFVLDYSMGIVELEKGIYPLPPWVSYLHLDWDCNRFQDLKREFLKPIENWGRDKEKYYCHVGMWGKKLFGDGESENPVREEGIHTTQIMNRKVKYTVRLIDPTICKTHSKLFPERYQGQPWEMFECMGIASESKIGAICDHDRGAPVTCHGIIRAVVLAGVTGEYCNNTIPMPFLVLDSHFFYPMYTNIHQMVYQNLTDLGPWVQRPEPRGGCPRQHYQEITRAFLFPFFLNVFTSLLFPVAL